GVEVVGHAAGERSAQDHPACPAGELVEGVAESVEGGRGGCGARLVELGGGAVGVGDGEVDSDAGGGGDDGDGDVRVAAHGDERVPGRGGEHRSEEHTSELQSRFDLVCRLLLEKKKNIEVDKLCKCNRIKKR